MENKASQNEDDTSSDIDTDSDADLNSNISESYDNYTVSDEDGSESVVSATSVIGTLKYINEKHGLQSNLSEYTNNKEEIDKIPIYVCVFYSDTTIPSRPFVKFVVEKKGQTVEFPFGDDFDWSSSGSNEVVDEIDETMEDNFQKWCSDRIVSWFIQDTPPKFEYQGYLVVDSNIFAFFELSEQYEFTDTAKYTYSIVDEFGGSHKTVSHFFEKNPNLRYYYDENDYRIPPPHMGYKVDDMGLFPGDEGQYFAAKGTDGKCAFFADTTVFLLGDDMIESFKEKRRTPEFIIQDYDSIFFKKDGNDYWFIPGGDSVVPLSK
jgi:hypothetical protein